MTSWAVDRLYFNCVIVIFLNGRKFLPAIVFAFHLGLTSLAVSNELRQTTYTDIHIAITVPNGWHAAHEKDDVIDDVWIGKYPSSDLDVAYQVVADTSVLTTSDDVTMKRGMLWSKARKLTYVKHLQDIRLGRNRFHLIYFAMDPKDGTMYVMGTFYCSNRFAPVVIYSKKPRTLDQVMKTSLPVLRNTVLR